VATKVLPTPKAAPRVAHPLVLIRTRRMTAKKITTQETARQVRRPLAPVRRKAALLPMILMALALLVAGFLAGRALQAAPLGRGSAKLALDAAATHR
jgi:hypothetical protein